MLRGDVSTMKHILKVYKNWKNANADSDIADFAEWFLEFRYTLRGFNREDSAIRRRLAELALPIYSKHLNADGHVSLLSLLCAISEAERFIVDPGHVFRKVRRRRRGIGSRDFGGAGVADLDEAISTAGKDFKEVFAAIERRAMGLS